MDLAIDGKRPSMTEARANLMAHHMLNEGLFDIIKKIFSSLTDEGKKAIGDDAAKSLGAAIKSVEKLSAAAAESSKLVSSAVENIENDKVKAAAEKVREAFKKSAANVIKGTVKDGLKALVDAGLEENAAKAFVSAIATEAITSVVGSKE